MERTVKGYSAALGFLFYDARLVGSPGRTLSPTALGNAPHGRRRASLRRRLRGGTSGKTRAATLVTPWTQRPSRRTRGAAEKESRKAGQHNTTSADVTPKMLSLLYDALVRRHLTAPTVQADPATSAAEATAQEIAPGTPVVAERPRSVVPSLTPADSDSVPAGNDANIVNLRARQTDFLAYAFYAFLFKTLARPLTLINLKYKDITLPDTLIPANEHFFNKCVP